MAQELTAALLLIAERLSTCQKSLMAKKIITNLEKNTLASIYCRKIFKYPHRMYDNNDRMPKMTSLQYLEKIGWFGLYEHFPLKSRALWSHDQVQDPHRAQPVLYETQKRHQETHSYESLNSDRTPNIIDSYNGLDW